LLQDSSILLFLGIFLLAHQLFAKSAFCFSLQGQIQNHCRQLSGLCKECLGAGAHKIAREFPEPAHFLLSRSGIILNSNRYYAALHSLEEKMKGARRSNNGNNENVYKKLYDKRQ
jgi:hypothetical protein